MRFIQRIIFSVILTVACSPKKDAHLQAKFEKNNISNAPIKSYSEYYLNENISKYNLKNWRKEEDNEDSLFSRKIFTLEKPNDFIRLEKNSIEINRISIHVLNDSISSLEIELSPFFQKDVDEPVEYTLSEYLVYDITDTYSLKYGKPSEIDSVLKKEGLKIGNVLDYMSVNWDFPSYSILLKAEKNFLLTPFQVSAKDKERYKKHQEKLNQMSKMERLDYLLNNQNQPSFDGIRHNFHNTYTVSISYRSKFFESQLSESFERSFRKKLLKDSIENVERVKKLKEKI